MKMDAKTARVKIWEELLKVARPDSKFSWEFSGKRSVLLAGQGEKNIAGGNLFAAALLQILSLIHI